MEDIEKITALIDKLNINQSYMGKIEDEDTQGIIYGVDSDDENPHLDMADEDESKPSTPKRPRSPSPVPPNMNNASSSNTNNNRMQSSFREHAYRQGYHFAKGYASKDIPSKYLEKEREIVNGVLNIDCAKNAEELVLNWINQYKLLIQTRDPLIESLTIINLNRYMRYKTTGVIANFFENTEMTTLMGTTGQETGIEYKISYIDEVARKIFEEFFGYLPNESYIANKDDVVKVLSNMKLCDPCNLENFFCQVREQYYLLKENQRTDLLAIVKSKLPYPMVKYIEEQLTNPLRRSRVQTLGLIERFAKEYRQNLCISKVERRYIDKVDIRCCKKLEEVPQEYGCSKPYKRKHKKYFKRYKPRRYKTYRKPWKSYYKKRFRKQLSPKKKNKYCPSGKKNCRCWLCQEEGHYANECPNKDKYKNKNNKLKMIFALGFEPIEENIQTDEEIDFDLYSLESETESEYSSTDVEYE
uniref:Coat protein n=1 Tax=Hibiscus soymovirus TaxID=3023608 RepID=A0AAF1C333_9VIRU|nr:coat protein [Hibiscus soymovirus]